jgi:hypothetical protein
MILFSIKKAFFLVLLIGMYNSSFSQNNFLSFGGENDRVFVSGLTNSFEFTWEAWVYYPGQLSEWEGIMEFGDDDNPWLGIHDGKLELYDEIVVDPDPFPTNVWTHVALTHSSTVSILYINGVEVATGTVMSEEDATGTDLYIGGDEEGGDEEDFSGYIDEVRIWEIVRTQQEIMDNMSSLEGSESGLVAYFKFCEGICAGDNLTVTNVMDSASAASQSGSNDGTLLNFELSDCNSNFVCAGDVCDIPENGATGCDELATIPTMGQWGVILLSILMLILGTVVVRYRSKILCE